MVWVYMCDVIWETPAYGGANSASLDQPFPYTFIFIDCSQNVQKARKVFTADVHMWQKDQDLNQTPRARHLIRACSFCPSISRVDVTYLYDQVVLSNIVRMGPFRPLPHIYAICYIQIQMLSLMNPEKLNFKYILMIKFWCVKIRLCGRVRETDKV